MNDIGEREDERGVELIEGDNGSEVYSGPAVAVVGGAGEGDCDVGCWLSAPDVPPFCGTVGVDEVDEG